MATKIRLQRHGKKRKPFYHIVIADSRAKRDGKFIEKIGTYNPNTNPATIELNIESALKWVQTGAEMTDTARAILSYKGVLYKNHLVNGVKKGALTEADVEKKFNAWLADKDAKIAAKRDNLSKAEQDALAKRMAAEVEVNAARAKAIEAKNAPEVVEEEAPAAEEATEEAAPAAEAEVTEEAPAAEVTEEAPAAEATEEAPAAEGEEEKAAE
jgi:small subunit ribosomal protein S16